MNTQELCGEFKAWLEKEDIKAHAEGENCFRLLMNGEYGLFQIRTEFEGDPILLQVICAIPVRVSEEQLNDTGLLIHSLNCGLRLGAFRLHRDCNVIALHLAMPIREESELARQFEEAVYTTFNTVDDNVRPLLLHLCSTAGVKKQLATMKPKKEAEPATKNQPRGRLEMN